MADNDWNRKKTVDNRRNGGPKTVRIEISTHFDYDWSQHAGAAAAANNGLAAFRAWIATGPLSAEVKAHWGAMPDPIVNDARLAVLEPA